MIQWCDHFQLMMVKINKLINIFWRTLKKSTNLWTPSRIWYSLISCMFSPVASTLPEPFPNAQTHRTIAVEVLTLGSFFGGYWSQQYGHDLKVEKQVHCNAEMIEISGHLTILWRFTWSNCWEDVSGWVQRRPRFSKVYRHTCFNNGLVLRLNPKWAM